MAVDMKGRFLEHCSNKYVQNFRETDGLKILADIYWKHTEEIWRQPDVLAWLETATHSILPEFEKSKNEVKSFAEM